MAQINVSARLALGFGTVLLLLTAISAVGMSGVASIRGKLDDIVEVHDVETARVTNLRGAVSGIAIAIRNMALLTDEKDVASEQASIAKQETVYTENYQALGRLFNASPLTTDDERRLFAMLRQEEAATLPLVEKEARSWALSTDQDAAVKVLVSEVRPKQVVWLSTLDELLTLEQTRSRAAANRATSTYATLQVVTAASVATALLIGLTAAFLITRGILRQLGAEPAEAQRIAREIAAGNLAVTVKLNKGDAHSLMASLDTMRMQLTSIVTQIKTSTESIAVRAVETAEGNVDLSQRTEQQAASLQQTAASMAELTTTVRQNSEDAMQASAIANIASDTAVQGGHVVKRVVTTMQDISTSSSKVGQIISVIEGIAFQTNILALNAAVEAARAGNQGRGFAVVASEVRTLAQRSAGAAKEIKALIEQSAGHVVAGAHLVTEAGATIDQVMRSVHQLTGIMGKIAHASTTQTAGIEQVNHAVAEMDKVTQQNAALVEQVSTAARSMASRASGLRDTVAIFRIGDTHEVDASMHGEVV
ncbi:methyl-accepting chemotaxis protein [Paraburkholderia madseniana]|uniref:methyl-accepting chemotaxis protein n=1 Tax=Paraburkholderia madseniana TaxID=2599607 RepID=UPI0015C52A55|nr:methyl-accepting chemotaxis protein [Paraburkholderia madseniana]NPT66615.1 methyl-accepting chemotaxis protein [Paraburkholderia madseniana]